MSDNIYVEWLLVNSILVAVWRLTCVVEGPTFLRGTLMWNPSSGSFLPLRAGSSWGSTPLNQSAHVSRTDTMILQITTNGD